MSKDSVRKELLFTFDGNAGMEMTCPHTSNSCLHVIYLMYVFLYWGNRKIENVDAIQRIWASFSQNGYTLEQSI